MLYLYLLSLQLYLLDGISLEMKGGKSMQKSKHFIICADVLPEVFSKVVEAKQLLSKNMAKNSSDACRMVGISRSAFYKYKDKVDIYDQKGAGFISTLYLKLSDEPGVLSKVLKLLYELGVNILTVNQKIPVDAVAIITIGIRINRDELDPEDIVNSLSKLYGVVSVKKI